MADLVLQHMNAQNRPFNAQNIADALGRHGIKKGPAQKHLDALADKGAINVKEAGKQKVYFALQTAAVMAPAEVAEAEATIKAREGEVVRARTENQRRHAKLAALAQQLTVKQMKAKTAQLTVDNTAVETKLAPLRAAQGADVSPADLAKMEKEFVELVDMWSGRKRRFNDAFETVLEGGGMAKKKFADDVGVEFDPAGAAEQLAEYKALVDVIKRKKQLEARQKKFKQFAS